MERARGIGGTVLSVATRAFTVVWLAYAIWLSLEIWSDRCPFAPNRCDFGPIDDGFAAFQLVVALGGAWFLARRRWGWAAAVLAFWLLVPFLLLWTSQQ